MRVIEVFAPLFGHWQGSEEQYASAWTTAGQARAMISFRADVGGAAVVTDYRQVRGDGSEFYAHGVLQVDEQLLISWWLFDSLGTPPVAATGRWTDGLLVLTKITERGVAVHRFATMAEDLTYAVDVGPSADRLEPFLRGRYQAISTH